MSRLAAGIDIEVVRVGELVAFAARAVEAGPGGGLLPISPWRAASQARNPCASADDVALVVAREKGRIVGYFGCFAALFAGDAGRVKFGFASALLVDDAVRGKGVGGALSDRLAEEYGLFVVTTVSPAAEGMLEKLGYSRLPDCETVLVRMLDLEKTRQRCERAARVLRLPFVRQVAEAWIRRRQRAAASAFFGPRIAALSGSAQGWSFRRVDQLGPESSACLDDAVPPRSFVRGSRVVNWMLANPWVLPTADAPADVVARYYFASAREEFEYHAYEVSRDDVIVGCAVFQIARQFGGRILRVLDFAFREPALPDGLVRVVAHAAERTSPDAVLLSVTAAALLGVETDNQRITSDSRPYFYRSTSPTNAFDEIGAENVVVDLCDADFPLT